MPESDSGTDKPSHHSALSAASTAMQRHSLLEDVQAILAATLLISLGVTLLGRAELMTGGAVGLTFLLHYQTQIGFGKLFFLVNLPFYALSFCQMGWRFTLKTFCAVFLLSLFSEWMPSVLQIGAINMFYAGVAGGLLMGVGMLILFRHQASLGGFNVLVLYLQKRFGWRAGMLQLGLDVLILAASLPLIPFRALLVSLLAAFVLNISLAINHRSGRYMAI